MAATPQKPVEPDQPEIVYIDPRKWAYEYSIKPGIARGVYYRLHPKKPIFLFAPNGGGGRFARLFRETWLRIPLGSQRTIFKYWRIDRDADPSVNPSIELLAHWSDRHRGRGLAGDKAAVSRQGHVLRFWTRIVEAYPDELVRDLIAHELAHVEQHGLGFKNTLGADGQPVSIHADGTEWESWVTEGDADVRMEDWGFDANAMDEWDRENGVTHPKRWEDMSESSRRRYLKRLGVSGR